MAIQLPTCKSEEEQKKITFGFYFWTNVGFDKIKRTSFGIGI